jgi:uncharacterized protein (TIGR03084 family)
MSTLDDVLADLTAEGDQLDDLVAPLDDAGWRTPTPAEGWTVAHQVAHLAWTDECAVKAATDKAAWDELVLSAIGDPDGFVDVEAARGAAAPHRELLDRWRTGRGTLAKVLREYPADQKLPWFGPPMSATSMATARFMETWAHGRDVADGLGVTLPSSDRVRHVVHLGVRTRGFAFANNGLEAPAAPIRVSLTLPSGAVFEDGPADAGQSVTGSAYDFALLVTQRAHRDDLDLAATGPDADTWLGIAQAFAGPSGGGRPPKKAAP